MLPCASLCKALPAPPGVQPQPQSPLLSRWASPVIAGPRGRVAGQRQPSLKERTGALWGSVSCQPRHLFCVAQAEPGVSSLVGSGFPTLEDGCFWLLRAFSFGHQPWGSWACPLGLAPALVAPPPLLLLGTPAALSSRGSGTLAPLRQRRVASGVPVQGAPASCPLFGGSFQSDIGFYSST